MPLEIIAALIIACVPVLATLMTGLVNWRLNKSTHVIVNSQRTAMIEQITVLRAEVIKLRAEIVASSRYP